MSSLRVHRINAGMSWAYLLEAERSLVLVDAGSRGKESAVLRRMADLGRDDLSLIFITHAHLDHYGSAAELRRHTGAPIAVHRADAEAMARGDTPLRNVRLWGHVTKALLPHLQRWLRPEPTTADIILEDGDDLSRFGVDASVIHTPGHTDGSSTLMVEGRLAFVGDLISTMLVPHVQLIYAMDWDMLYDSVRRLKALRPEMVYSAHGRRPMTGDALQRMKL